VPWIPTDLDTAAAAWLTPPNAALVIDPPPAQFTLDAPAPALPVIVDTPTAAFTLTANPPIYSVNAPVAQFTLAANPPTFASGVSPPTATLLFNAPAPTLLIVDELTLISPTDDLLVPTPRPTFTVQVITTDPYAELQIQYDTDDTFPDPTDLTAPIVIGQDIITMTIRATNELTDDTAYFWRARVINPFDATDWTDPASFLISLFDGDALASGGWSVSTATTAAPHAWFVYPPSGRPGDTAYIFGTGFGPTAVSVTIAGQIATVEDWDIVAADADAYTADREINPLTAHACPGHQVITITVPDAPYPGGALYVDGS
jgi:hypothetical protein